MTSLTSYIFRPRPAAVFILFLLTPLFGSCAGGPGKQQGFIREDITVRPLDRDKLQTAYAEFTRASLAAAEGNFAEARTHLERALELQKRGYIVTPDPSNPLTQAAYKDGAIKEFERHSRLGFIDEEGFYKEVQRLRDLGFKRVTVKTGAYSLRELAMAIKWSSRAKIDLLTIDGSSGGTGMSPWRMMEEWGVPSLYLHSAAYDFCNRLKAKGERVPDIAFAGGFSSEDGIFKALALGSPFVKAVCMGRALMIPGMVGKNIALWLKDGNGKMPNTVGQFGSTPEEIFVNYEDVKNIVGLDVMKTLPLGAVGIYTFAQKLKVGLQQFMAGARCFNVAAISRRELMALTDDCARVTGIPYLMDAYRDEALKVIDS